jgi:indolepyruvate ferredoxin oxidoreductase
MWEAPESISYNLHPPLLRQFGLNKKLQLGPWFRYPLLALARFKFLRGTPFDLFGYAAHRRRERDLIHWYRSLIETVLERLSPGNLDLALEIAALPDQIRGYERIKEESIAKVRKLAEEKLETMQYASVTAST